MMLRTWAGSRIPFRWRVVPWWALGWLRAWMDGDVMTRRRCGRPSCRRWFMPSHDGEVFCSVTCGVAEHKRAAMLADVQRAAAELTDEQVDELRDR